MTIEKNIEPEKLEQAGLTIDDLAEFGLKEAMEVTKLPSHFPTDPASIRRIFVYITEAVPAINGGTKAYIHKMCKMFRELTEVYSPSVSLFYINHSLKKTTT